MGIGHDLKDMHEINKLMDDLFNNKYDRVTKTKKALIDEPVKLGLSPNGVGEVDGETMKERAEKRGEIVTEVPRATTKLEDAIDDMLAQSIPKDIDTSDGSYVSPFLGATLNDDPIRETNLPTEDKLHEANRKADEQMAEYRRLSNQAKAKIQDEVIGHLSKERIYKMSGVVRKEEQIERIEVHIKNVYEELHKAVSALGRLKQELE